MEKDSEQDKIINSRANANQSFFFEKNDINHSPNSQVAQMQPPEFSVTNTVVQRHAAEEGNSISIEEARRIILNATRGPGTNEADIYDAISRCSNHRDLRYDAVVINALNGDMQGHDLWKSYLLIEYGSVSNFPSSIQQLWNATEGGGTNEAALFVALESMDNRAKTSFGLRYILHSELSGDDLERALDLITTRDSMRGNLFGSQVEGNEELVVNESNLRELIDSRFVGGSSSSLKSAMETLYNGPNTDALATVESIRGLPAGMGLTQYNKAMEKQTAGVNYYRSRMEASGRSYNHARNNPSPPLTSANEDFTASNAQLRFGKILGDVFGIDAVFGSLISPTGGIPGEGNERISAPILGSPEYGGAVSTHGTIHDAAGYLYNCHGIGPGYDYLHREPGADPANPLAGQTNIQWWIEEFDRTGNDVEALERFLGNHAYIGAAFSKNYGELNTDQKKEALRVMCNTSSFMLSQGGISNTDRVSKINELMDSCSAAEKIELANYFYNHDGFNTVSGVYPIMRPHVSEDVYETYERRRALYYSVGPY